MLKGTFFLLDPQHLAAAPIAATKQLTSAYLQGLVLRFPRLSNSGAVVKSVVVILIVAAEVLMGLVRVLPCVLSELYFFTSYYMHIRVFHP